MVISVREHWLARSGSFGAIRESNLRRQWTVQTSNKYDDAVVIRDHFRDALGITYGTAHPNPNAVGFRLARLDPDPHEKTPRVWNVVAEYNTGPLTEDNEQQQIANPLLRPTIFEWSSELSQEFTTLYRHKSGGGFELRPMMSSAGETFEPVEVDDVRWIISAQRNFPDVPAWVLSYVNCVNEAATPFGNVTFAQRTLKFQRLRIGQRQVENEIAFVPVTADFAYRDDAWDIVRIDEGFLYLDGGVQKKIMLEDEDGNRVYPTEPIPLNGSGAVLDNPTESNAVKRKFRYYAERDFSQLPF